MKETSAWEILATEQTVAHRVQPFSLKQALTALKVPFTAESVYTNDEKVYPTLNEIGIYSTENDNLVEMVRKDLSPDDEADVLIV